MSEILIKNMELPKQGWKRLILLPDGEVREICGDEAVRATNARAVELPEHGDLIDRQVVVKQLSKAWNVNDDDEFANKSVWRIIEKEAPTILETSEEKA